MFLHIDSTPLDREVSLSSVAPLLGSGGSVRRLEPNLPGSLEGVGTYRGRALAGAGFLLWEGTVLSH